MNICAVIVAGGSGKRMGADKNKVLMPLMGQAVIRHTVDAFCRCKRINKIVIVTRECDIDECKKALTGFKTNIEYTVGGKERQQSVFNGLKKCANSDYVLIHDAARALIDVSLIEKVIDDCMEYGAAAVGVKCKDTLKQIDENGFITGTIDREYTYNIQTPQAFKYSYILSAHEKAELDGINVTDDCAIIEYYGGRIKLTEGNYDNIKLTTPDDMAVGEIILTRRKQQ